MNRIGNLYESIIELENIKKADENAQKGKKRQKSMVTIYLLNLTIELCVVREFEKQMLKIYSKLQ